MDSTSFSPDHVVAPGVDLDVVIMGDLRVASEAAFRTVHQTTIQANNGYKTGLLHAPCVGRHVFPFVNPEIDQLVRAKLATPIDPAIALVTTRLLIVETPIGLCKRVTEGKPINLPRIVADNVVILLDDAVPIKRMSQYHAILSALLGSNAIWAATTPEARASLLVANVPVQETIWRAAISTDGGPSATRAKRDKTILGRTAFPSAREWPAQDTGGLQLAYPTGEQQIMRVLALPWLGQELQDVPDNWFVLSLRHMSSAAFLRNLDYFLYFPESADVPIPAHAMAWAMAHGVPVIADSRLRQRMGKGPTYVEPTEVADHLERDEPEREHTIDQCVSFARDAYGPHVHENRVADLVGPPRRRPFQVISKKATKRVLFTCTNGMGIGHVTRLLAVARRLPKDVVPVFAILSPAAQLVRQAGYPVEYIPSARSALCDPVNWNNWFRDELMQIMEFHDIQAVMFDGGQPYQGLISAMRARPFMRSVWMRRGLWREDQMNDPVTARQHYFDLIIEPSDIAENSDQGATVENRDMVHRVDPIQLLDEEELLDRQEAADRIGLDPERPACLIQLGAGFNRDQMSMMDSAVRALRRVDGLQIVLARWPISTQELDYWPDTLCLRSFPTSKYYNAFDFTISATGYNSFHEIISFGLPAIFMANTYTGLDDQAARAEFAQENDAGFHLPETRVDAIGHIINSVMDESTKMIIRSNCRRLSRPNGAAQAAEAFAKVVA